MIGNPSGSPASTLTEADSWLPRETSVGATLKNGAALFPMVTMNGEECHNEWEITFEEIHRNLLRTQG